MRPADAFLVLRSLPVSLLLAFLLLTPLAAPLAAQGIPQRKPEAKAKAHKVYEWKTQAGLRYHWCLPKGYSPQRPVNLTVILHGSNLNRHWGFANNRPGVFRPDDVVVSPDGTTPAPAAADRFNFLGGTKDAEAVLALLKEIRSQLNIKQTFLYGHSQGSFFAVYFAGEYPDEVAGVAAHASGAWNWSKTGKDVKKVAIAFMHGTADPVVPYRQSVGSRDHYAKLDFPMLHLRRLPGYNHWPNAVRANEVLAWCEGMSTKDPKVALATAEASLQKKGWDEYRYMTPVAYAGARDVLRRFLGGDIRPFDNAGPEQVAAAKKLAERIEAEGESHVQALRKYVATKKDLRLDDRPWLGHLVSLREDFRGVDSVEAYMKEIGYDQTLQKQGKSAAKILKAWYNDKDQDKICRVVLKEIPAAFLHEGYPPTLRSKMAEWHKKQKKLSKNDKKAWKRFVAWEQGWDGGLKAYEKIWKVWK